MQKMFTKIADYIRECDKILFLLCLFATSYGCVAVLSATYHTTGSLRQFIMQAVGMTIGVVAVVFISTFDYRRLERLWPVVAALGLIPVILTFFIGFAPTGTDDKAWLMLPGGVSFQPAELLKICFVVTFAYHIQHLGERIHKPLHLLLLCIHGAIPVVLIHFQGDDGTALVFLCMFLAMLFAAGVKLRYFIAAGVAAVVSLPIVYFFVMNDAQRSRIMTMFNIEADLMGDGWQQWQGRIAMANGGFTGKGLFNGPYVQSGRIPEGENDFIFTSIGEELGLLGCIVVVLLLAGICLRILQIGRRSDDKMGHIMCIGVFGMFLAQSVINLGMCLSILPVIGVTLPFFSAGGTSIMCLFFGVGLVMSVYMAQSRGSMYLHG